VLHLSNFNLAFIRINILSKNVSEAEKEEKKKKKKD